jgi:hypothetical protein
MTLRLIRVLRALLCFASAIVPDALEAAVIEFYNPDLDHYFITANPVEQRFIDTGAVGRWQRTGNAFAAGGPDDVCRFYGNALVNPVTGSFFGPNSHFYTADTAECASLKTQYDPVAKSWKFESDDFPITTAVNSACPAGLIPVYRAYNNGFARGFDSNHRITSNHAAYLQTVAAGSRGEGVVMCAPSPAATAVGVATGSTASATVGSAGGSVTSSDGRLVVIIPPGALAADTAISVQPFSNTAHGKIGAAYRLSPSGQTFLQPVTLRFAYAAADLAGTAAEVLGAAFQTDGGYWQWAGRPSIDIAARTVSVSSSHFSIWSLVKELQIHPASAVVNVNDVVALTVIYCYEPDSFDPRGYPCVADRGITYLFSGEGASEWSVNGRLGGNSIFGQVVGFGRTSMESVYGAPAVEPIPNTVAVTTRVNTESHGKVLLVSNITIRGDSWTGTATGVNGDAAKVTTTAEVTWTVYSVIDKVVVYSPSGIVRVSDVVGPGCTARYDPADHVILPSDGTLTIDFNVNPPTYLATGLSFWPASMTAVSGDCEGGLNTTAGGLWLGGDGGPFGLDAHGVLTADGTTIEGTGHDSQMPPATFTWKFTRNRQ